ncbi:DUF916 domain-containing protein [Bombilactobacillus thymidiniphilus]|uniref:DUF916 and DUF3324 domain-containing protein n=1 Tax=Bombilactobacillus thymidiniphilus TaxID=2923363 RepID=A0ABY4PCE0_9LACO|nr:DUF916 domain-containing protein [Bombilactobacillus thymidiniphilus]UQS83212.1 DUF916 and DUF3324 domain-containing protein [Bombilactobacillus thymidiniphilus]
MKYKISMLIMMICSWFVFLQPTNAQARSGDQTQPHSFSVRAILPDNQINNKETFYDLKVTPDAQQDLKLAVINLGTKTTKVTVAVNDAYTSNNGIISYDRSNVKLYKANQPSLSSLIVGKHSKKVILKPQETKVVSFTYKAPKNPFSGIILGGVSATANAGESTNSNFAIQNRVQYVTGIVLRSKPDEAVTPNVTMSKDVVARSRNMQKGIGFELRNSAPINVSGMKLRATFIHNGKKTVKKMDNLQMAPNSIWHVLLPFDKLPAGSYKLTLVINAKNGYSKTFVRHFTITQKQATKVEKSTQPKRPHRFLPWLFIFGILIVLAVVLYLLWIYMRGQNQHRR